MIVREPLHCQREFEEHLWQPLGSLSKGLQTEPEKVASGIATLNLHDDLQRRSRIVSGERGVVSLENERATTSQL